jgi:hypothetical protein
MAGSLSNYGELLALDVTSGYKTDLTGVTQDRFVALFTGGTPDEDGTLPVGVDEVSAASYGRKAVTFSQAATPASGQTNEGKAQAKNSAAVTFDEAATAWGLITAMAIYDAVTGGNMIWVGSLTAAKQVDANDQLIFKQDNIIITMD